MGLFSQLTWYFLVLSYLNMLDLALFADSFTRLEQALHRSKLILTLMDLPVCFH